MAKIYGLFGSMTGKLADVVMVVRNGEQIARKFQPVVFNPSTQAQVAQRAKLKLLSQLSAVMAPVIAIRRIGSVSARNLFTKVNFGFTSYASNTASVDLNLVQLTSSSVALPAVGAARGETAVSAYLTGVGALGTVDVNRVVYCMFEKQADNKLRFLGSSVATSEGDGGWGVENLPLTSQEFVVLAYGVRDNSDAARTRFGNLETVSAVSIATLLATSILTENDVTLTETRGVTIAAASQAKDEPEKKARKN